MLKTDWSIKLIASDGVNSNGTTVTISFLQKYSENESGVESGEYAGKRTTYIVSGVVGTLFFVAIAAAGFLYKRTRKQRKDINRLTEAEIREFREGTANLPITRDSLAINVPVLSKPYNNQFEIPRDDLKIGKFEKYVTP